jgi:hypothetical protein
MALRKEDFDEEDENQETSTMKRSRITIDISPELRRRIKIAALQNDSSISEYVGDILEKNVPDGASMIRQRRPATRKMLDELIEIRDRILQERNGQPFEDSTEMIRQMREERSRELEQL